MLRTLIVLVLATVLLSCDADKSKNGSDQTKDTTNSTVSESPVIDSPKYSFRLMIHEKSNWDLKIDSITTNEFDQRKIEIYQDTKINGDSLINAFSVRFKDVIILEDSCCIFKGWDKDVSVCMKVSGNDKESKGYTGIGYDHGYIIVKEWGYEIWSYIGFNPNTKHYFSTVDEPRFIDNDLIYSAGNYYLEGQFQIINMKENRYFGFDSFNWELSGFYEEENSIFMEFISGTNKKYLKVTFR